LHFYSDAQTPERWKGEEDHLFLGRKHSPNVQYSNAPIAAERQRVEEWDNKTSPPLGGKRKPFVASMFSEAARGKDGRKNNTMISGHLLKRKESLTSAPPATEEIAIKAQIGEGKQKSERQAESAEKRQHRSLPEERSEEGSNTGGGEKALPTHPVLLAREKDGFNRSVGG